LLSYLEEQQITLENYDDIITVGQRSHDTGLFLIIISTGFNNIDLYAF